MTVGSSHSNCIGKSHKERIFEMMEIECFKLFYKAWIQCESNRGCYSCCPEHDSRCPKDRKIGDCKCGRDNLEILAKEIDEKGYSRSV